METRLWGAPARETLDSLSTRQKTDRQNLHWKVHTLGNRERLGTLIFRLEITQNAGHYERETLHLGTYDVASALEELDFHPWSQFREIYTNLAKLAHPNFGERYYIRPLISLFHNQLPLHCARHTKAMHAVDELHIVQQIIDEMQTRDPDLFDETQTPHTTSIGGRALDIQARKTLIQLKDTLLPTGNIYKPTEFSLT